MKKKSGLGRGLGSLLLDAGTPTETMVDAAGLPVPLQVLLVGQIEPNPFQPRRHFDEGALDELAESIRTHGLLQPISVRAVGDGQYQLIAGERRWQATQRAGLPEIAAFVREATEQQMLELAIIENIQREDLNAMEVAYSYQRLISECQLRQEDLSARVGKQRSTVANYLRLLRLPPSLQQAVEMEQITMGHARAMLGLERPEDQLFVFGRVTKQGLSVRETEQMVRSMQNPEPTNSAPAKPNGVADVELADLQRRLAERFGTRVQLKSKSNKAGQITIPYTSLEELNRVLEMLL